MVSLQVLYQWFPSREAEPSLCGSKEHQDHWFVSLSPDGQGYDHLCATGSSLRWYRGLHPDAHTLQKVYTVEDKILQTLWCTFEDKDSEKNAKSGDSLINKKKDKKYIRCICIREQGLLSLFMESGAFYYVPLPFMVKHIWSLKSGILIERHVESQIDDHLPVLFTLTHPLDDLCPVTFRRLVPFLKDTSMSSLGYITSPQLKIVAVCSDHTPPLAVIYDKGDHIHTLWCINEATTEDIPSPVSTPGPGRIGFVSIVTPAPLSSSAPARYSHYSPLTPIKFSLQVQPPVPTATGTVKKHNTLQSPLLDSLKPLPIQRLQQRGSPYCFTGTPQYKGRRSLGGDGGASGTGDAISRIASGRSPYINRYVTPQSGQQVSKNPVRAKSLSPRLHYARISPYSQTMNSRSWSTFYNEDLLNEHVDSLLPQICLHQIWAELPDQNIIYHCSSNTFVTCDVTGTNYLCFHLSTSNQLWLLSLSSQGDTIDVGPITTVHNVYQVVNLSALKMMLILTVNGDIVLYSGDRKVIDVNASFLYSSMGLSPDHTNGCEAIHVLRDAIGSEFTVVTKTGLSFRCSIPQSPTHPVVSLCLQALCSVLPAQTCIEFMVAYCGYSFCSNSQIETSWNRFENWLYACLRMRPSLLSTKKMDVSSGSDPWSMVLQLYSEDSLLSRDPVLKLLTKKEDITSYANNQGGVVDSTHTVSLEQHIVCVTSALHLVYEELKLDVHLHQYLAQLASLLCMLSRHLGWTKYIDYYCRDIPTLFQSLSSPIQTQSTGESHHNMVEDKPVYDLPTPPGIYQYLYALLQGQEEHLKGKNLKFNID